MTCKGSCIPSTRAPGARSSGRRATGKGTFPFIRQSAPRREGCDRGLLRPRPQLLLLVLLSLPPILHSFSTFSFSSSSSSVSHHSPLSPCPRQASFPREFVATFKIKRKPWRGPLTPPLRSPKMGQIQGLASAAGPLTPSPTLWSAAQFLSGDLYMAAGLSHARKFRQNGKALFMLYRRDDCLFTFSLKEAFYPARIREKRMREIMQESDAAGRARRRLSAYRLASRRWGERAAAPSA